MVSGHPQTVGTLRPWGSFSLPLPGPLPVTPANRSRPTREVGFSGDSGLAPLGVPGARASLPGPGARSPQAQGHMVVTSEGLAPTRMRVRGDRARVSTSIFSSN